MMKDTTLNYSGNKTSSALIRTGIGNFYRLWMILDGINDYVFSIYDGLDDTGDLIIPATTISSADFDSKAAVVSFNPPIRFTTGLYVKITTSGSLTYQVYYNTKQN